jgi:cytochrome bd ubiquinol oxidase subunit II
LVISHELLIYAAAAGALVGLMAYAVLGGADFGGGVWDLFATGPRKEQQRAAIAKAMGPVWEANHVWLIFVIVVLFTCFPAGFAALGIALFVPFHLALIGIMLRGASFVFRGYAASSPAAQASAERQAGWWGTVFGVASVISPFLLGLAFGVVTEGAVRVDADGGVTFAQVAPWFTIYAICCGLLSLSTCAYLAAVYLTVETEGALREDFRRRAITSGTATAALALLVLVSGWFEANWFVRQLIALSAWPVLVAGLICFAGSAWAVFGRRYRLSRLFAAGQIVLLLLGWGLAQRPYLIYPDVTLHSAAAPRSTIAFLLASLPFGALLVGPSLWMLIRVFKSPGTIKEPATLPK